MVLPGWKSGAFAAHSGRWAYTVAAVLDLFVGDGLTSIGLHWFGSVDKG